jgi:RNA polymerase sigma-70 factor (ECF subfamily)
MRRFQDRLDAEAFEEIVRRFTAPALAAARQILSNASLAEDAVQETFLRVVRGRRRYCPSRPFSSWFYSVCRNVCVDMLRRQARQAKLLASAAWSPPPAPPAPWEGLDAVDLLAHLPHGDRMVLTLRVVHELAFGDIAAVLGISEEAAKKRAQRALRRLREDAAVRQWSEASWAGERESANEAVPDAVS